MRSVIAMIAGIDPPMPAGCQSLGRVLADLSAGQCRFPLSGEGVATRFCAAAISDDEWQPGKSGGCYCRFHRAVVTGRGTDAERAAPRVLERLG